MQFANTLEMQVEQRVEQRLEKEVREVVYLLMRRPITEEIAMRVEAIPGFKHLEITDGEWVGFEEDEFVGGERHGWLEALLLHVLVDWTLQTKAGHIYSGDTVFVLKGVPGRIELKRQPDIAFVAADRVRPSAGCFYGAPDLAVEIISPSERPNEIQRKLQEYLASGVRQVWHVFPDTQEIVVHFPDGSAHTYRVGAVLPGGELLPGLSLNVADIFQT